MPGIVIYASLRKSDGLGHFFRCKGYYDELCSQGRDVAYALQVDFIPPPVAVESFRLSDAKPAKVAMELREKNIGAILVDSYQVEINWLEDLQQSGLSVFFLDTQCINPRISGVINTNPFASSSDYNQLHSDTNYFIGVEYYQMRSELLQARKKKKNASGTFVCIGGSDVLNITVKFAKRLPKGEHYKVILGPGSSREYRDEVDDAFALRGHDYVLYHDPTNYFELLATSQNAVLSCSTSVYEAIALDVPFMCVNVAGNQNRLSEYLVQVGAKVISANEIDKFHYLKSDTKLPKITFGEKVNLLLEQMICDANKYQ